MEDYRIGVYIDGHFHGANKLVPVGGVDLYQSTYGQTGRTNFQPTEVLNLGDQQRPYVFSMWPLRLSIG